jgi:F-type H+-transporting ATPase subunit b
VIVATSNFLVPNATFVVELAAFLLVLAVLAKYVLPRVNQAMDERQAVIRQSLVDAEEAKQRAAAAETDYSETMARARSEARAMVDEANKLGEQLRAELRQRGEQEYERIIARATADIESSARRASEELRQQIAGMVITVVEKVIGEGLDDSTHRALIDRTIADVEAETSSAVEVNQ